MIFFLIFSINLFLKIGQEFKLGGIILCAIAMFTLSLWDSSEEFLSEIEDESNLMHL